MGIITSWRPDIIISGGQSGADFGGLLGARDVDIATGGVAPKGWKTENGSNPELGSVFSLLESESEDYDVRTKQNIDMADVTILIAYNFQSPGSQLTHRIATLELHKPIFNLQYDMKSSGFKLYWSQDLELWLNLHRPSVINIAGNRESKAPGIQAWTRKIINSLFSLQLI